MRGGRLSLGTMNKLRLMLRSVRVLAERASDRRRLKGWHRERHKRRAR